MKIFRFILVVSLMVSGYIGYENFPIGDVVKIEAAVEESVPDNDSVNMVVKIIETLIPLLAPVFTARRRKTLDDEIADVADKMGLPKKVVRDKLGIGDRRKKRVSVDGERRKHLKKS